MLVSSDAEGYDAIKSFYTDDTMENQIVVIVTVPCLNSTPKRRQYLLSDISSMFEKDLHTDMISVSLVDFNEFKEDNIKGKQNWEYFVVNFTTNNPLGLPETYQFDE